MPPNCLSGGHLVPTRSQRLLKCDQGLRPRSLRGSIASCSSACTTTSASACTSPPVSTKCGPCAASSSNWTTSPGCAARPGKRSRRRSGGGWSVIRRWPSGCSTPMTCCAMPELISPHGLLCGGNCLAYPFGPALALVGAALCRDGLRSSPRVCAQMHKLPGLLRSPFATQGRSYRFCACLEGDAGQVWGFSREESDAVNGTGCAGVHG